jgi:hypothetical protein
MAVLLALFSLETAVDLPTRQLWKIASLPKYGVCNPISYRALLRDAHTESSF